MVLVVGPMNILELAELISLLQYKDVYNRTFILSTIFGDQALQLASSFLYILYNAFLKHCHDVSSDFDSSACSDDFDIKIAVCHCIVACSQRLRLHRILQGTHLVLSTSGSRKSIGDIQNDKNRRKRLELTLNLLQSNETKVGRQETQSINKIMFNNKL